jgi:hypothetical protein
VLIAIHSLHVPYVFVVLFSTTDAIHTHDVQWVFVAICVYYIILLQACVERDPKILKATTEL